MGKGIIRGCYCGDVADLAHHLEDRALVLTMEMHEYCGLGLQRPGAEQILLYTGPSGATSSLELGKLTQ